MTKLTITAAEDRLFLDIALNEHVYLVRWLAARVPPVIFANTIEKHALVALAFSAESDWSWRQLASYALHEMKEIQRERDLTPMEQQIRSIAERVYDSEISIANRLGMDLFPNSTDRAAARRLLDERFARALKELQPYIDKKERTIQ